MLHGAVSLNLTVAAVMVGDEESLGRYELSGAAASEVDHGILKTCLVDAVDILGRESESLGLHIPYSLRNQERKPHALVCGGRSHAEDGQYENGKVFLHIVCFS